MKSSEKWGALVLSAAVLLSVPAHAGAADTDVNQLPRPAWTSSAAYDTSSASAHEIHFVQSRSLVYVHTVQNIKKTSSKTSYDWYLETVTAFDASTGTKKWSRTFHDKAGPYTIASSMLYAKNGTVYFVGSFSDKTQKIFALSPEGKEIWNRTVPFGSDVYLLGDESLLIASTQGPDKQGIVKTNALRCSSSGKTLSSKKLTGSVLTADAGRIVVDTSRQVKIGSKSGSAWDRSPSPSIEVYTLDLNRVYTYKFPSSVNLLGDGGGAPILVQDDGSVLFRGSVAGTVNKLFAFSPQGRLLWGRVIPSDSVIASTGSGYVTYSKSKLTSFNLDRQIAEQALDDKPGQIVVLERSADGKIQVDMADTLYILDPIKLNVIQAVSNLPLRSDYAFAYADGVLYAAESGSLVKYTLN